MTDKSMSAALGYSAWLVQRGATERFVIVYQGPGDPEPDEAPSMQRCHKEWCDEYGHDDGVGAFRVFRIATQASLMFRALMGAPPAYWYEEGTP